MKIVLLSGGSGKRLWPLSNGARSKQFLKVLHDEAGNVESMLQRIYRQIRKACPEAEILIAASEAQRDSIRRQIGEGVEKVIEPSRRNTYPAILLSGAYLLERKNMAADEIIAVIPVDSYVEQGYFEGLSDMERALKESGADICLLGIKPTYPSEKYGYIVSKEVEGSSYGNVLRYVEKPDLQTAKALKADGAFWNGGVFVFRASFVAGLLEKEMGQASYAEVHEKYEGLPEISFDYEVIEKNSSMICVTYQGEWNDLGTWNTLTEKMKNPDGGYVFRGEDCENTHVINELGIPVVALGLKDTVVVASADGILVSDKHASSYLKPYVEQINNRPMYEKRQWGEYKVLDFEQYGDGEKSLTKQLEIEAGRSLSYQVHYYRDEVWTIVDGEGEFLLNGVIRPVSRGDVLYIKRGHKHAIHSEKGLKFIEVQIGSDLVEEDIERFDWDWTAKGDTFTDER